jgi:hypothetical protein
MRNLFALLLMISLTPAVAALVGCGEEKPDPRSRPDFVDTSDPSKIQMLPSNPNQPANQPAKQP